MNKSDILTDSIGRKHNYLRISLIEKCNLRCTYCMPEEGLPLTPGSQMMTAREIIDISAIFVRHGVNKIRLTGGEPLLRKDISTILEGLSALPVQLSLTTNAVLVDKFIQSFVSANLHHLNVSLDTLREDRFFSITHRRQFHRTLDNLELLVAKGFRVKLNVVLIKGVNDDEVLDFIELTKERPLEIRFIEFMPFDGNHWDMSKTVSQENILDQVRSEFGDRLHKLEDEPNFTARSYQIDGYEGRFGIISTVTNPFCDGCNRIRLLANGRLKNCLFSAEETDLLTSFRRGEDIEPLIQERVFSKHPMRAGMTLNREFQDVTNHSGNRSMVRIGG